MNNKELEMLVVASEKLCLAAKKTYGSKGLGLSQLLIAINEYELTKNEIEANIEADIKEFNKYNKAE